MLDTSKAPTPDRNRQNWFSAKPAVTKSLTDKQMGELRQRVIKAHAATNEIAEELALTLNLAQRIRAGNCSIDSAYSRINYVFDCLLLDPSKLVEARGERLQLQFDAYRHAGGFTKVLAILSGGNATGVLIVALTASLIFWTLVAAGIRVLVDHEQKLAADIFFMNGRAMAVISSDAFIGGVISIAIRLREFSQARDLDPFRLFLTVMFKPLIGVVLSWFLLATLAGEVVSLGFLGKDPFKLETVSSAQTQDKESTPQNHRKEIEPKVMYVIWILGFLAGFSERFAWDFVDRAEGLVAGGLAGGGSSRDKSITLRTPAESTVRRRTIKRKRKPDGGR
jgi:hypothetical protein